MTTPPRYGQVQEQSRLAALCALGTHSNPAMAALAVIDVAHDFFARIIPQLDLQDKVDSLACKAGCNTCCYQIVGVSSAELALLRQAIAQLPPAHQKQIHARAQKAARTGRTLDQDRWWAARIPCPLLDQNGQCALHPARPLPCRAMNSADADICRRTFEGESVTTPILAAQHGVFGHAQAGLLQALRQMGTPSPGPVNLAVALADQLRSPR